MQCHQNISDTNQFKTNINFAIYTKRCRRYKKSNATLIVHQRNQTTQML